MSSLEKKEAPFMRSANNYDTDLVSRETGLECKDESRTQQQFAEECDINFIADQFGLTGELPTVLDLPKQGDFTGIFDFQSAMNQVVHAQQQFLTLPAKLRARFDNSPQKLLDFMGDPENREEAERLGLVPKPVQNAPESPLGDAGAKPRGDSPSPGGDAPAKPDKPAASPKKDT